MKMSDMIPKKEALTYLIMLRMDLNEAVYSDKQADYGEVIKKLDHVIGKVTNWKPKHES
jgi:hypothetical protein